MPRDRITFVLPGYPRRPTGGYKVAYTYADWLAGRGHKVVVVHGRTRRCARRIREVATGVAYGIGRTRGPGWYDFHHDVSFLNLSKMSAADIPAADIIVATAVSTASVVASVSATTGSTGAYLIQHYETFAASVSEVHRSYDLPLTKVVVSPWLQDILRRLGHDSIMVENAIDGREFPVGPPPSTRGRSVLAMTSPHHWKRTDLVIEVFRRLRNASSDVSLVSFGVSGQPPELRGVSVHFTNPSPARLVDLYQNSRIYMCTSDYEGYGLPVGEAMASGCSVVTTAIGGVAGFANGAVAYAEIGSADSLYEKVSHMLEDDVQSDRLASRASVQIRRYGLADACAAFEAAIRNSANQDK